MLAKQILKDHHNLPMGVFIPMETWNAIVVQYPDIETLNDDIPQWEKDCIDNRLNIVQNQPERLQPIEKLFEIL
ncbi:MAG: hypothetical protein LBM68_07050 [Bacteroidales bacterium]|jgi:hypothetical protein|nr:hypothetical protein [Bacteroidales bacterium]